jgi:DNA-directed RNA polymerase alpha subunit
MTTEYRIREVTRYVITKHSGNATHAMLSALQDQLEKHDLSSGISIDELNIQDRWRYSLQNEGIWTVGDLRKLSGKDLYKLPNIGLAGRLAIQLAVSPYGGLRED